MKRRSVLFGLAASLSQAGAPAYADTPRLIGWLTSNTKEASPAIPLIVEHLARSGFREGRDVEMAYRYGDLQPERYPALARELVGMRPAVLVAYGNAATQALRAETRTIPIVMYGGTSPVAAGLVDSLARPGGNVTGTTHNPLEIAGKAMELLHSVSPRIARVTVVWNPDSPGLALYKPFAERTAQRLKLAVTYVDVRRPEQLRLEAIAATRPDALYFPVDPIIAARARELAAYAAQHRLPSLSFNRLYTAAGGLLAIEPELGELAQNVADFVVAILRDADPAVLPVRDPTRFRITVNMAAARSIGLQVPKELLLQASEVVE